MPIPTPNPDESQDEFVARCMANDEMTAEYPDEDQRAAICFQQWRDRNKEEDDMSDKEKVIKIFDSFVVKESKDNRTLNFVGSKEIVDRDREVVKVKGMDLKNFKRNPVVLWSHQYDKPPVAKATKVWKSKDELKFKVKFAEPEEYGFADTIYKLYKGGYMSAVSIGFIPDFDAIEYPKEDKKGKGAHRIFNKSELIELSLVPVGANPEALLQSKGIKKALKDKVIDEVEFNELEYLIYELDFMQEIEEIEAEEKIDTYEEDEIEEVEEKTEEVEEEKPILCSECKKEIKEIEENKEDSINKTEDNYIDELLSVLRSNTETLKKQEEDELDKLLQILKEGTENDG